jgi:hypothetical protein
MSAPEGKTDVPRGPGHFRFWTRRRPLAVAQYAALSFWDPPRTFTIVDIDFVAISTATLRHYAIRSQLMPGLGW